MVRGVFQGSRLFFIVMLGLALVAVSAQAFGDGKWGYAETDLDTLATFQEFVDAGSTAPSQTFADAVGEMAITTPFDQFGNYDYYITNLYAENSKDIQFDTPQCCFYCGAFLNGQDVTQFFYESPKGKLTLNPGWNKLELFQRGHYARSSRSPRCNLEIEFPTQRLGALADGMNSFRMVCDPRANECCESDGSALKAEGADCAGGDGKCDADGRCTNADGDEDLCKEQYGDVAFLPLGGNNCCGDDDQDCGVYNQGFFCKPGSGWMPVQPNLGKVVPLLCAGPVNVVLDTDTAHGCFAGEIPLNYDFSFELRVPRGDNKCEYRVNGQKSPSGREAENLATPYSGFTETRLKTNVYMAAQVTVPVGFFCDSGDARTDPGVASTISVDGKTQQTASRNLPGIVVPGGTVLYDLELPQGFSVIRVLCKNDAEGSGQSQVRFFPPISSLVHAMSSNLTDEIFESLPSDHTQMKFNESLGLMEDFLAGVGGADVERSPFDQGDGSEQTQDSGSAPTTAIVISEDQNIKFQFGSKVENPVLTGVLGDLRAIYVGPPPEPPVEEFVDIMVANHGYLCAPPFEDQATKVIAECAGAQNQHIASAPADLSRVGESFDAYKEGSLLRFFCSGLTGQWVTDLDTFQGGHLTCEAARLPSGAETDFEFTGTRCCQDEAAETYNDPWDGLREQHGGCINSTHVDFGDFPLDAKPSTATEGILTNYLGIFQGCGINQSNPLMGLTDMYTSQQLINVSPVCDVLEDARGQTDFFCSVEGKWQLSDDERPLVIVQTDDGKQGCCAADACFAGNQCISNQQDDPKFKVFNGQRCLNGAFVQAVPKFRFDRGQKGFCPRDDQCLVNIDGASANNDKPEAFFSGPPTNNPICIADKQFIMENVCENGEWTSRTKYVALQLEQLAKAVGGGYTIFCDKYDEVLNFFAYQPAASKGAVAREFLEAQTCKQGNCVNQFCGMAYKDGVAFGTSLNEEINSPVKSFLLALGLESNACDGVAKTVDHFEDCGGGTRVYYNPVINSVVYIPQGDLPRKTIEELKFQQASIFGPFDQLVESAKVSITPGDFVGRSKLFSKLFIDRRAEKEFFSFITEKAADEDRSNLPTTYIGGWYNQIDVQDPSGRSPCQLISTVDTGVLAGSGFCKFDPSSKKLEFVRYSLGESPNPTVKNWRDLTAKFRNR